MFLHGAEVILAAEVLLDAMRNRLELLGGFAALVEMRARQHAQLADLGGAALAGVLVVIADGCAGVFMRPHDAPIQGQAPLKPLV